MTIPNLPPFYLPGYPVQPLPDVVPFTARSGATFAEVFYGYKDYIDNVVVPGVNKNSTDLVSALNTIATAIIDEGIKLSTQIMESVANDPDSVFIAILNELYAGKSVEKTVSNVVSTIGSPNGIATLNAQGKLTATQLPSTVATLNAQGKLESTQLPTNVSTLDGTGKVPVAAIPAEIARSADTISTSAAGYQGSTPFVQTPTLAPSPTDARNLSAPSVGVRVGRRSEIGVRSDASAVVVDKDMSFGERRNLWQYTEDISSSRYGGSATLTVQTDQIVINDITLRRINSTNFYGALRSSASGLGITPFVVGRRYLLSYYAISRKEVEQFYYMRELENSGTSGHGRKLLQPNTLTRVWELAEAVTQSHLAPFGNPTSYTSAVGSTTLVNPTWVFAAGNVDMYIGGMQIDDVGTAKDGVAFIGDSTFQGAAGTNNSQSAYEIPAYFEGLLNCHAFNKAIGGQTLAQMDARWGTDMTPLAATAAHCVIQGGINDIGQGRTLAQMQDSVNSMYAKAIADGFKPVFVTITPFATNNVSEATRETIRNGFNDWLKQTFANVIDIAKVVADPFDATKLRRTPGGANGWYGDSTHYARPAKRAIAEAIASHPVWLDLPKPSPYQKITAAAWANPGGPVLSSPDGTKYRLTVANGGALTATPV